MTDKKERKTYKNYNKTDKQLRFLEYYLNPDEKDTYSNAYQSAVKAGFSKDYARIIGSVGLKWIDEERKKREKIFNKAEDVLKDMLNNEDARVAQDTAKFVAKTIGKKHYSEKQEVEHSGNITIEMINFNDKEPNDEEEDTDSV